MTPETKIQADEFRELRLHKKIPVIYQNTILTALAGFPELKKIKINFNLTQKHPVPYGTSPSVASLFKPAPLREYDITLLEKADEPARSALFKNLSLNAQIAVIAHELAHVLYFNRLSIPELVKTMLLYPLAATKKKLERAADEGAISHGFGKELYEHAVYIRSIPGYVKQRPEIYKHYLQLDEIMERLQ